MKTIERDLVVLGGGPGGYTAAFRAADLGRSVTLIEKDSVLGGVCLNRGCIPSKTLLHYAEVVEEVVKVAPLGLLYSAPTFNLDKIREHKEDVIKRLNNGLSALAKARNVEVIEGFGTLKSSNELIVGETLIKFNDLIISTGSRPAQISGIPYDDERVWDSNDALLLKEVPSHLAIIGGGIIGLEMAAIYHALGSKITIIEMADSIIPSADKDLKAPLIKAIKDKYNAIYTRTKVEKLEATKEKLILHLDNTSQVEADALLVAVGRRPNSDTITLENTAVKVNQRGFIMVDEELKTNVEHIYAIGDVTGDPMLAHRAAHQGKVAAEVASGEKSAFTPLGIPSVAYTHPEIAWVGLTENEAKERGIEYVKGSFPWQASSRAMSALSESGVTKALFEKNSKRLIGAGITGKNAGELISEALLALEMGAVSEDIALSIHAHPTLSETLAIAAELVEKRATDTLNR
ncbi:MAG: dihydrolipoyl dehydrogenase [Sphaerochaetaceae bacterium]|jgi:dihydrolipoamide dehydrogenase|nr:dihydrolipoyl dehydrogenase [Sphaerochaetaceae bacterium]HHU88101.1 dihydrolipoyl dehydrogenase [Spirochaetales bacterium]